MQFYKAEGFLLNYDVDSENASRRVLREFSRTISQKIRDYRQECDGQKFCFAAYIQDGLLTVGAITRDAEDASPLVEEFLDRIDCPVTDLAIEEVTINQIRQLLGRSCHSSFIDDDDEICEVFGIDRITGQRGRGIEFGENMVEDRKRDNIYADVEKYLLGDTMVPELDRIYAGAARPRAYGHPVHYIFKTDNPDTRRVGCQLLLQALSANGRLRSKRYSFLNFRPGEPFSLMAFDTLYGISSGGAVIIRYFANDDSGDQQHASSERETIARICEVAKHYSNDVLTIICMARASNHVRSLFLEHLGSMTFVELQEDFTAGEKAEKYLKLLAREYHVRADSRLFAALDPEKSYLAPELSDIFHDWFNRKLKTQIYPQYKNLAAAKQETAKAPTKGNAYDDLQNMVGLTEAKAVIRKALNYYKMQKLYEDKGIKQYTPAMHMVFTGNPGTAKTTAARLFARIMKDNGLLSKGQLVEVGRGDLVGKYVGWTAQTVQNKFKAAKGGVLFIDEAYSLVDGHSGSFGDEAINTIVQEMENHREDVVVIFAGYPNEMERFLQKNPGLRSRIAFHVPFADYNTRELCSIAELMLKSKGMVFADDAMAKLETVFASAQKQSDFGNGRYVRNLLEQASMSQASRLLESDFDDITTEELRTIRAVDITIPERKAEVKRTIGFAC